MMSGMDQATVLRYDPVSRALHWSMAALLFWQFASAGAHFLFEDTAIEAFLWPTHKPAGVLLLLLALLRLGWAASAGRRPPAVDLGSRIGHVVLYVLMIVVPTIALIRQYGSGRAFAPFGIPLFAGFEGERIDWTIRLGGALHGELGWLLLLLVLGHVGMAFVHRDAAGRRVLHRMW